MAGQAQNDESVPPENANAPDGVCAKNSESFIPYTPIFVSKPKRKLSMIQICFQIQCMAFCSFAHKEKNKPSCDFQKANQNTVYSATLPSIGQGKHTCQRVFPELTDVLLFPLPINDTGFYYKPFSHTAQDSAHSYRISLSAAAQRSSYREKFF